MQPPSVHCVGPALIIHSGHWLVRFKSLIASVQWLIKLQPCLPSSYAVPPTLSYWQYIYWSYWIPRRLYTLCATTLPKTPPTHPTELRLWMNWSGLMWCYQSNVINRSSPGGSRYGWCASYCLQVWQGPTSTSSNQIKNSDWSGWYQSCQRVSVWTSLYVRHSMTLCLYLEFVHPHWGGPDQHTGGFNLI